jgi:hypothetical protein
MAFGITPVILTCDGELSVMRRFVLGFGNVRHQLKQPTIVIDLSRSPSLSAEYLAAIGSIAPADVFVHPREPGMLPYDSVQEAANFALSVAVRVAAEDDYILFLEDDLLFSSRFAEKVVNTYLGPETGFFTLYLPGDGYGSDVVDPSHFYGSQCLLFTRHAAAEIVGNIQDMMLNFQPGYDIRWSRFLAHKGYVLYAADHSYVQHQHSASRLHGPGSPPHVSKRFVP